MHTINSIKKELNRTLSVLKQALKEADAATNAQARKENIRNHDNITKKWLSLSNREDRIGNAYDSMKQLTERFNKEK